MTTAAPQLVSNVMVLDDEEGVLELTALFLRDHGHVALPCKSAQSAVERFKSAAETVELVIADVTLRDGSGIEAGVRLSELKPGLKLLFMSGYTREDWSDLDAALFSRLPSDSVRILQKPFSRRALLDKVNELIDPVPTAAPHSEGNEATVQNDSRLDTSRARDLFLAGVGHELRGPLHTIIGFADLLAEELKGPLNDDQKRYIGHILGDSQLLLKQINELLDLSRIQAGELEMRSEVFDLRAAIDEVSIAVRPQLEAKAIHLEMSLPEALALKADWHRVKQIFTTLLDNAIGFTPHLGRIRVGARRRNAFVEISVSHNGIGISQAQCESAFEGNRQPGATGRDGLRCTALDLAVTKALVERHGGRIRLESERGQGSCFTFTLPEGTPATGRMVSKDAASCPLWEVAGGHR